MEQFDEWFERVYGGYFAGQPRALLEAFKEVARAAWAAGYAFRDNEGER